MSTAKQTSFAGDSTIEIGQAENEPVNRFGNDRADTQQRCPLCGSTEHVHLVSGDRHQRGLVTVLCKMCGLGYLFPQPSAEWLSEFYAKDYWKHYLSGSLTDQHTVGRSRSRQILHALTPILSRSPARCLDIGSGAGGMLAEMRVAFPNAEIVGVEPAADAEKFCRERLGLHTTCMGWATETPRGMKGNFDLITCVHVLEHTPSPLTMLQRAAEHLAEGGWLYVEVPDLQSKHWQGIDMFHIAHLLYFSETSLRNAMHQAGLRVEQVFHGMVDDWPWGTGVLARHAAVQEAIAAPDDGYFQQIRTQASKQLLACPQPASKAGRMISTVRSKWLVPSALRLLHAVSGVDLRAYFEKIALVPGLAQRIEALERRVHDLERSQQADSTAVHNAWLQDNRAERMDATSDLFDPQRSAFHLARYQFATQFVHGNDVADIACGTGYGSHLLARHGANSVVGVDIDPDAVNYAAECHSHARVRHQCSTGDSTGLPDESVDVVVSFETIEHVPSDSQLLAEFARILRPAGVLICSTPNQWPLEVSEHHVRVYDHDAFLRLLSTYFESVELFNQNSGSHWHLNHGQSATISLTTPENIDLAECYIAVCCKPARPLPG